MEEKQPTIQDVVDARFDAVDARFDTLEGRTTRIESTMITKDYLGGKSQA